MSAYPELQQSVEIGEDVRATFRRLRLVAGVDQKTIAQAAGIDRATYNRWERGKYPSLDDQRFVLAAGFLCTCRLSNSDRKELIETLAGRISGSTITNLETSLTHALNLVRRVEEELFRLRSFSSNS